MIHLYEGDGKGKTTAAYGLCVRMTGQGGSVAVAGFLKPVSSGEYKAVSEKLPETEIGYFGGEYGFVGKMSEKDEQKARSEIREGFFRFIKKPVDLLVLDEITDVLNFGFIEEKEFLDALFGSPAKEIVMTGRRPSDNICRVADYHTRFEKIKHPFDKGQPARAGIEF